MNRRAYQGLTDDQLETLIRQLPRREPGPGLRERILSHRPLSRTRRAWALRPACLLAAVVLLLVADALVMRCQDAGLTLPRTAPPAAIAQEQSEDELWLADMGVPALRNRLRLAMRHPSTQRETYFELRQRMLEQSDGG